jgi:hypothetical protein
VGCTEPRAVGLGAPHSWICAALSCCCFHILRSAIFLLDEERFQNGIFITSGEQNKSSVSTGSEPR